MDFEVSLKLSDQVACLELSGDLDASSAHRFKEMIDLATAQVPKHLILMMRGLRMMPSVGFRAIICAKQRMGAAGKILLVGAQQGVLRTLMLTGFDRSVEIFPDLPDPLP
jgi:anti-anti-sigma factor